VSRKQKLKQAWKGAVVGAILTASLGSALLLFDFRLGEALVRLSYDLPFRARPIVPAAEVVLVYLDDASHRDLGQPYTAPWDRGLYARLLERLTAETARAVTFDIIFSDPNPEHPDGDERFANAIKANGKVVLGADYMPAPGGGMTFIRAMPAFRDVAAAWGMVQVLSDQDFVVRQHFHVPQNKDDDPYSSLTWELARVAGAKVAQDPQERYRERWLNYYGPLGIIPNVSFELALETNSFCPAGFFSNKVVIVGQNLKTFASGVRKDEFRTPYTRTRFGPAVDVQATQVLNLVRGDWLTRSSHKIELTVLVLMGIIFGFGLPLFRPMPAVALALAGALLVTLAAHLIFFQQRFWFPWMIVVAAQIPAALLWSVAFNSVQLYVQNRLYQQSLEMYLSPKLVKKFSTDKNLLQPGARKQVLTALFSDIADFSSISEGMDSDELAHLMNHYFDTAVSLCIHATDGTVVKYIGDGIFAFWNAPDLQVDHAMRACEAALLFSELPAKHINGRPLATRLGLHTGVANVGNFGSVGRVDYTAVGETINLASRMEGLNKYLGTRILMSADTQKEIAGRLLTRFVGPFRLKGFERAVDVYELAGRMEKAEACHQLHEAFAQALNLFREKDFTLAQLGFRRALEISPTDGPTQFYLKTISEIRDRPLPDNWKGETEFLQK
jgi:adenylate cyclase